MFRLEQETGERRKGKDNATLYAFPGLDAAADFFPAFCIILPYV
jgi:hypothetical protein